jgi:hypothetical protein
VKCHFVSDLGVGFNPVAIETVLQIA